MTCFLVVLSSPSGGGKTSIAKALLAQRDTLGYSISATTRPPRTNEHDGTDYHFLSQGEFERRREAGEFLEWAEYGKYRYGTLQSEVDRVLASGRHAVLDIEVQGARQIRQRRTDVVSIFILPPSAEALHERLGGRSTDRPDEVGRRLRRAVDELLEAPSYDYVVVNDDLDAAVAEVVAIIHAETRRAPRLPELAETIETMRRDLARIADKVLAP